MDMFGDYSYMFYMCGGVMLAAGIFLFIMNYYHYKRKDATRRARERGAELQEELQEMGKRCNGIMEQSEGEDDGDQETSGDPVVRSEVEINPV